MSFSTFVKGCLNPFVTPLGFEEFASLLFARGPHLRRPLSPHLAPSTPPRGGRVFFTLSGLSQQVNGEQSILAVAENLGLKPAFGCRKGQCRSCVVPLVAGQARRLGTEVVSPVQPGQALQICIHAAAGDVSVAL